MGGRRKNKEKKRKIEKETVRNSPLSCKYEDSRKK